MIALSSYWWGIITAAVVLLWSALMWAMGAAWCRMRFEDEMKRRMGPRANGG